MSNYDNELLLAISDMMDQKLKQRCSPFMKT